MYQIDEATGIKREVSGRVQRGHAVAAVEALKKHRLILEPALVELVKDPKLPKEVRGAAL